MIVHHLALALTLTFAAGLIVGVAAVILFAVACVASEEWDG